VEKRSAFHHVTGPQAYADGVSRGRLVVEGALRAFPSYTCFNIHQ
jgi:hypothetical protein